jgi:hypothetical protein
MLLACLQSPVDDGVGAFKDAKAMAAGPEGDGGEDDGFADFADADDGPAVAAASMQHSGAAQEVAPADAAFDDGFDAAAAGGEDDDDFGDFGDAEDDFADFAAADTAPTAQGSPASGGGVDDFMHGASAAVAAAPPDDLLSLSGDAFKAAAAQILACLLPPGERSSCRGAARVGTRPLRGLEEVRDGQTAACGLSIRPSVLRRRHMAVYNRQDAIVAWSTCLSTGLSTFFTLPCLCSLYSWVTGICTDSVFQDAGPRL